MKKPKRIRVEVVPGKVWDGRNNRVVQGWLLRVDGGAFVNDFSKRWLVAVARDVARDLAVPCELYIRRRDGTIGERSTFPRSSDSPRTKG